MRLGLICLVIVNYCHSSLYSQFFFFFFFLFASCLWFISFQVPSFFPSHLLIKASTLLHIWDPYGVRKRKKKKQKAIRIGCHDPHHLSQLDDDCHCCTFTFTCTHNFFFITHHLVAIFKYCCLVFSIMEIRILVL